MKQHKHRTMQGQALVEFALIVTVLLMMIFVLIESARIMWGWATVQHAAREGARYATTGQFEGPDCAVSSLPKFATAGCGDLRTASVISLTHRALSGLPLDETSFVFEDDNYYNIQVWGVDTNSQLQENYAGSPGNTVVVRVTYKVPIITPFLSPIVNGIYGSNSVPIYGQVTMTNESFGQLGGVGEPVGAAPELPPLPTPGPTPTFTPTPTHTPSPTVGATATPTDTPTNTPTATPEICPVQFEALAISGNHYVMVTGDPGTTVNIVDLTTGLTLGSDVLIRRDNHACEGFTDYAASLSSGESAGSLSPPLVEGHVIVAQSSDGSFDTTVVVGATPTPTPTSTHTPVPTATPTHTPVPTATASPTSPFIYVSPSCQGGPDVQFTIFGFNWPTNEQIFLFWEDSWEGSIAAPHAGSFQVVWTKYGVASGTFDVSAQTVSYVDTTTFEVPCDDATPVPVTSTPTSTPAPADLIVIGEPELISTPPIVAYQPVQYRVTISNTGDIDVSNQFFVDLYFDPVPDPNVGTDVSMPITYSVGYGAVSSLPGGASRVITITAQVGFKNNPSTHTIYGMVDSIRQISEDIETNNISEEARLTNVRTVPTPTPSPTPSLGGGGSISGEVRSRIRNWIRQPRAVVKLWDGANVAASAVTDANGYYSFSGIPVGSPTYTLTACIVIDGKAYVGQRTGIVATDDYADIFMLATSGGCP